jgi:hypothetical protein
MEVNMADILRIVPDNPEDICCVHLHQLLNAKMSGTFLRISAMFTSIIY